MSILTHKMKTARQDYLGDNCKLLFPFNEGNGTQVSDIVGGVKVTISNADHNTPNAVVGGIVQNSAPDSGVMPAVPKDKSVIMFATNAINNSAAYAVISVGSVANTDGHTGFSMTLQASVRNNNKSSTSISFGAFSTGDKAVRCLTFNNATGELRAYSGTTARAVALDDSVDASDHKGKFGASNLITIGGNVALINPHYLLAFLVVDSLPSDADLASMLDWTLAQNVVGHKVIHPDFAKY